MSFKLVERFNVASASPTIDLDVYHEGYDIYGTATLAGTWAIGYTGTPRTSMRLLFDYYASVTLSGQIITILGTQVPDEYALKKFKAEAVYTGSVWSVRFSPSLDESAVLVTANYKDESVTLAKVEDVTATYIIVGNGSNRPTAVIMSGDITISNAGVTSIGALKISNGHIAAAADIALSKIIGTPGFVLQTDGVTGLAEVSNITDDELLYLDVTPGTAEADKAVVLTTGKVIDELDITLLKIGTTTVTATAAELNVNDGVVAGTASANKTLVLGATREVDYLDITDLQLNGVQVTSTAAEINKLDALTAVTADLELLAGLAASGVVAADLQAVDNFNTIMSASTSGLTLASGKFIRTQGGLRQANTIVSNDALLADTNNIIICDIPATHIEFTFPALATVPEAVYMFIVKYNAAGDNLIFTADGAESVSYAGAEANSKTVVNPSVNAILFAINDGSHWTIGV